MVSPWGTPEVTLILIDLKFLYETMCILIVKNDNDSINDGNGFRISIIFSFCISAVWFILSNTFLKSKYITSNWNFDSKKSKLD